MSRIRHILAFAAMALILLLLVQTFRHDRRERLDQLRDLMAAEAASLVDVIAESSGYGLGLFNGWENEVQSRLSDNAEWIAHLDSIARSDGGAGLQPEALRELAGRFALGGVEIRSADGSLLAEALVDTFPAKHRHRARALRAGGGWVAVRARSDERSPAASELGPGRLIRTLGSERGIRYVVVQDDQGIQAASTRQVSFPALSDDPGVEPLFSGEPYVTREYDSELGPVLEVARITFLGSRRPVLLRVGLDAGPLEDLRDASRRRTWVRGAILASSLLLFSFLLLGWQRQGVLDREVRRVSRELRATEEQMRRTEKLAAMGSLAAGVAHQVRNPLNSIHMIAQLLGRRDDLPAGVRAEVGRIRDESGRIESIVQQFLRFARPREPELATFDLGEAVREAVAVQAAAHASCDIGFVGPTEPLRVELDRGFVTEIIENLVRNAVEAAGEQGRVRISLRRGAEDTSLIVADDGPGVPDADRDRIFDLYFTTRPEGTGLGLSLCAQMAAALGGSLELEEGPGLDGRGASFLLRLPDRGRIA